MGWLCKQVGKTLNATCTECSPYCISLYDFRDIQREILRTRPKTNNKAWIKLSEAILNISRDSWEKCIWSSHPAKLLEEFPASKVHLQPATLLTGKFPSRQTDRQTAFILARWYQRLCSLWGRMSTHYWSVGMWL